MAVAMAAVAAGTAVDVVGTAVARMVLVLIGTALARIAVVVTGTAVTGMVVAAGIMAVAVAVGELDPH
jgi:hypothetical protein